jgi:spermidine synthase
MNDGRPMSENPPSTASTRLLSLVMGIVVFMGGAVSLGLEIAASRVLAPFFGTSLYVWGALIGVVLTGLSIGYWAGGILADRWPTPRLLVAVIAVGAVLVLAIPLVDQWVLERIVSWDPGPRLDPVVAAVALFGPPSLVLACVSPIAVRLFTRTVDSLGRTAGRLFSVSTAGSIAGTFVTAFWLVPSYGTRQLIAVGAAALFVTAALLALVVRRLVMGLITTALALAAVVVATQLAPVVGNKLTAAQTRNYSPVYRRAAQSKAAARADYSGLTVRFQKDTRYHRVAVTDDADTRYLRFDSSFQSGMRLADPYATVFNYTDTFHLAKAYNTKATKMLFIGLGGGSAVKRLWRDFPDLTIDAVEIDPVVIDVARKFFKLPTDARLTFAADDGRQFLLKSNNKWDVIAIDVFYNDGIPFHMTTEEFYRLVRAHLRPGGVVLMNTIGFIRGANSKLLRSIIRTQQSVFNGVHLQPVIETSADTDDSLLNVTLVATIGRSPSKAELADRWKAIEDAHSSVPALAGTIANRYDQAVDVHDVPVLTDDFAPTDALLLDSSPSG